MIRTIVVQHVTFETHRPFDDVVHHFSNIVGSIEHVGWDVIALGATDSADFERRVRRFLGPSGFARFLTINHGEWLTLEGQPARFIQYTVGNPLIARTMLKHHVEAGLDVLVRIAIYEHSGGKTRLVFNTPSSLMSGLDNDAVHAAAVEFDANVMELAEAVTGVKAEVR